MRFINVPGSLWLYVVGALAELAYEYNWEKFGTATPEQMAQFFADILDDFQDDEVIIFIE